MKPPPFTYHRPSRLDEALAVLDELGGDGKVLAGGQSLVPMLNMRLASPAHLVDINHVPELAYVRAADDGVRVGAAARHSDVEHDQATHDVLPLLRQALQHVAHPTIRNRGTTVGSLAHADPAGELTAVLALLGGTVELARSRGARSVGADDFFTGPMESCIEPGELAVSAFFPRPDGRTGTAFVETARRNGDYALCGLAALVKLDDDLRITSARAGYVSVAPIPLVLDLTEPVRGRSFDAADWDAAGRLAESLAQPDADIHASAAYRRHLVRVLTVRAFAAALADAVSREVP